MALWLDGYFDESERNDEGLEPLSVAGYIFKPTAYRAFCRDWREVLRAGPRPTTHFHMTHLYARTYEYEGWSVEDRANVLRVAIAAVRKHMFCGVSVLFSQVDFEELAPPLWRVEYGSMYAAACQMVLNATGFWMHQHRCFLPITYAFESGHRFWDEADQILKGTNQFPELKKKLHYRTHVALDKTEACGLQAADMFAWIMSRLNVGVPENHTMGAFSPIILSLVQGQSPKYQLFHPDRGALLSFFEQAMSRQDDRMLVTFDEARQARKWKLR
jgi:hypothetical protein